MTQIIGVKRMIYDKIYSDLCYEIKKFADEYLFNSLIAFDIQIQASLTNCIRRRIVYEQ